MQHIPRKNLKSFTLSKILKIKHQKMIYQNKKYIGITGLSIKTEKEYYVDECLKLYGIFKVKTYGILALHLLLNILLIYQVLKVSKLQVRKEKINKDDAILFDEEQNIKF